MQNPGLLEGDNKTLLPNGFEITLVQDLAGKFAGQKTFIEHLENAIPQFYEQVGQQVLAYVASPPKIMGNDKKQEVLTQNSEIENNIDSEQTATHSTVAEIDVQDEVSHEQNGIGDKTNGGGGIKN